MQINIVSNTLFALRIIVDKLMHNTKNISSYVFAKLHPSNLYLLKVTNGVTLFTTTVNTPISIEALQFCKASFVFLSCRFTNNVVRHPVISS